MLVSRPPRIALRPFVRMVWAMDPQGGMPAPPGREHALPTGQIHLALRLDGPPLRIFSSPQDVMGTRMAPAVVGGARTSFYIREAAAPARSAGVMFAPGGAAALFGLPADEIGARHVALDDLWGSAAGHWLERLAAMQGAAQRLGLLEDLLWQRLAGADLLPPSVRCALARLEQGAGVADAVRAGGSSHRHMIQRVRQATGLSPKAYSRVVRLQRLLRGMAGGGAWADLAAQAGYSDQAHFSRDFRSLCGITPTQWLQAAPEQPNHVAVPSPSHG